MPSNKQKNNERAAKYQLAQEKHALDHLHNELSLAAQLLVKSREGIDRESTPAATLWVLRLSRSKAGAAPRRDKPERRSDATALVLGQQLSS